MKDRISELERKLEILEKICAGAFGMPSITTHRLYNT